MAGFYRSGYDELSPFSRIEWDPDNMLYVECGVGLYQILLRHGMMTLSDRKGSLLDDMLSEFENLFNSTVQEKKVSESRSKLLFSMESCSRSLTREYIMMLGKLTHVSQGRNLLLDSRIPKQLVKIGTRAPLDYFSRLVITSLLFTNYNGMPSKTLVLEWTKLTSSQSQIEWNCSHDLRVYIINLLRVMIHSREEEFALWGFDALLTIFVNTQKFFSSASRSVHDIPNDYLNLLLTTLDEAFRNRHLVSAMFKYRSDSSIIIEFLLSLNSSASMRLLIRVLSAAEGVETLAKLGWLEPTVSQWQRQGSFDYVHELDTSLAKVLNRNFLKRLAPSSATISVPTSVFEAIPRSLDADPELVMDLEGLFRLPWNVEVKISSVNGSGLTSSAVDDYISTDCFLDTTDLPSPYRNDVLADERRVVRVRALVLDSRGLPSGIPIGQDKIIRSALMCGVCPVRKDGSIVQVSETRSALHAPRIIKRSTPSSLKLNLENTNRHRSYSSNSTTLNSSTHGASSAKAIPSPGFNDTGKDSAVSQPVSSRDLETKSTVPTRRISGSIGVDHLCDWSLCKPGHRGVVNELGDGKFSVEVPGEPVVWIFGRSLPIPNQTFSKSIPNSNSSRANSSWAGGGFIYLLEVHYQLRLETKTVRCCLTCTCYAFKCNSLSRCSSQVLVMPSAN